MSPRRWLFFVVSVLVSLLGISTQAAPNPFCTSTDGINEIRDYFLCQSNPKLDACFNLNRRLYMRAGKAGVIGALAAAGTYQVNKAANKLSVKQMQDAVQQSQKALAEAMKQDRPNIAESVPRALDHTLKENREMTTEELKNYIRALGKELQSTQSPKLVKEAYESAKSQLNHGSKGLREIYVYNSADPDYKYVSLSGDSTAKLKIEKEVQVQIMQGRPVDLSKAIRNVFGKGARLVEVGANGKPTAPVEEFANWTMMESLDKPIATALAAEAVEAAASTEAIGLLSKRSLALLGGVVGAAYFVGDAMLNGAPTACGSVVDGWINRTKNCDVDLSVNQTVANYLDSSEANKSKGLKIPGVCDFYEKLHSKLMPPFHLSGLKCPSHNEGIKFSVTVNGSRTDYRLLNQGSKTIQQMEIRPNGNYAGNPIRFNADGSPSSGLDEKSISLYQEAKLHASVAEACCAGSETAINKCMNQYNAEVNAQGTPISNGSQSVK